MKKQSGWSLRASLFVTVLIFVVCVMLILVFVFGTNTVTLLNDAEKDNLGNISKMIGANIDASKDNLYMITKSWASLDDTYNFSTKGDIAYIPENFERNLTLRTNKLDFVLINDVNQKNIFSQGYDFKNDKKLDLPKGLNEKIITFGKGVIEKYESQGYIEPDMSSGLFSFGGISYIVCTLPILDNKEEKPPAGTITFGMIYNGEYITQFTGLNESRFEVFSSQALGNIDRSYVEDSETVIYERYIKDIFGNELCVKTYHPRNIYNNGFTLLKMTLVLLAGSFIILFCAFYFVLDSKFIKRISSVIKEVSFLGPEENLVVSKFGHSKEIQSLGVSINDMIDRLAAFRLEAERSQMSTNVLQQILDSLDACVFVSDIETNEILFFNERIPEHFNIDRDIRGEKCWQVLQDGKSSRCEFCPIDSFEGVDDPKQVWEEFNHKNGRHYRNTDRIIEWKDGRNVHIQHSVDISDMIKARQEVSEKLKQQAFMSRISQIFISSDDFETQINHALKIIGEFLYASRTSFVKCTETDMHVMYEWCCGDDSIPSRLNELLPIGNEEIRALKGFEQGTLPYLELNEWKDVIPLTEKYGKDIPSLVAFPIFLDAKMWGFIEFNRYKNSKKWTQSELDFGIMLSNVLSGVIDRMNMESNLVRLSSIVENSPQYIFFMDENGKKIYHNPVVEELSGYKNEELTNDSLLKLFASDENSNQLENVLNTLKQKNKQECKLVLTRKDGVCRTLSVSAFPAGNGYGMIGHDITELLELQKELIAAKNLAEQGSMAKGSFLSRMSHEMRTPMNAIIGMTDIALESSDSQKREYCLRKINGASTHLLGVINDILDMSKIEADKFELSFIDFSFERMMLTTINVTHFKIEEKNQILKVNISDDIPDILYGDDQRLAQVITNLLSNATKFTPENGIVTIGAELVSQNDDDIRLKISVTDTGIGISKEQSQKLFKSFEQADGGTSRKFGGTGLGLAISKRIIELMGGEIYIESEPFKGASFIFTVNLKASQSPEAVDSSDRDFLGADIAPNCFSDNSILLAEDIDINREIVTTLLEKTGIFIDCAENGRIAVEKFTENHNKYDLILMDVQMPEVDGLEATRRIRASGLPEAKTIPIIAMTANAFREDIEKCIDSGMDAHIAKPIEFDKLLSELKKRLSNNN